MPDGSELRTVRVLGSIRDVAADAWNACAGADDPFLNHGFLAALEDSRSVSAESGWIPQHLAALGEGGLKRERAFLTRCNWLNLI